jgi:anti-sigma regulatory factor (Ser/Thr protein kinase)
MQLTQQLDVLDVSHVAEARRAIVARAADLGFREEAQGRVAIVVTEAAKNMLKHARGGRILVTASPLASDGSVLQLLLLDSGPGLDPKAAMRDGFSTAGTPGTGLGAMQRMSDHFDVYSTSRGTAVLVEFRLGVGQRGKPGPMDFAALAVQRPGEKVSGDGWRLLRTGGGLVVMVADGLGHGLQAAAAAEAALAMMDSAFTGLEQLMEDTHRALRATRGAAIGIARLGGGLLEFVGVGNVACRVVAPEADGRARLDKQMVSHNGTVGHAFRKKDAVRIEMPASAFVILHSDGLSSRFSMSDFPGLLDKTAPLVAGVLYQRLARHADDATIVVLRPPADDV